VGGVVGGSSAGATIQSSYLARATRKQSIMMGDQKSFKLPKECAIDQQCLARKCDTSDLCLEI